MNAWRFTLCCDHLAPFVEKAFKIICFFFLSVSRSTSIPLQSNIFPLALATPDTSRHTRLLIWTLFAVRTPHPYEQVAHPCGIQLFSDSAACACQGKEPELVKAAYAMRKELCWDLFDTLRYVPTARAPKKRSREDVAETKWYLLEDSSDTSNLTDGIVEVESDDDGS